jgi:hypothetical protein
MTQACAQPLAADRLRPGQQQARAGSRIGGAQGRNPAQPASGVLRGAVERQDGERQEARGERAAAGMAEAPTGGPARAGFHARRRRGSWRGREAGRRPEYRGRIHKGLRARNPARAEPAG